MRALRYLGPKRLEIEDMKEPVPGEGEALLRVKAVGICGSDVHGYLGLTGRRIPPMTMGHEFSAEVVTPAEGSKTFNAGDKVVVQPINFCGKCENCLNGYTNMCLNKRFFGVLTEDGALAEYLAVPEKLLYRLPDSCKFEDGALAEPYAVGYGAVKKAGDLRGKVVLIIGAGTIGLCILQLVKIREPKMIIISDLSDRRLETALALGADAIVNPSKVDYLEALSEITGGKMADISIEAVGVQATANQSIKSLKMAGTSIWVGMSQKEMQINMQDIVVSARSVLGTFNYTHEEFGEVVDILGSGKLDTRSLISARVTLDEAPEYFELLHTSPDDFIKVVVDPSRKEGSVQ